MNNGKDSEQAPSKPHLDREMNRSSLYPWYVIATLSLVSLLSQLDRHFPALLVEPLKARFGMSDTQFGLLHGYAFALTYAIVAIPLGRLVDRANRRNLIAVGLLVWSLLTVLSAFAHSYTQLVIARMGVGIGEAVLAPAAYSIIADYFASEGRGKAMAAYYVSLTLGSGLAMIGGGAILRVLPTTGVDLPLIGPVDTWQAMFLLAGLPGALLVWLLLTVREPERQEVGISEEPAGFGEFMGYIRVRIAVFGRVIAAAAMFTIVAYGALSWAPAVFDRRYGIPPAQSGAFIGGVMILGGIAGPLLSGWLSDHLAQRRVRAARMWPVIGGTWVLVPAAAWAVMPSVNFAILLLALLNFSISMVSASMPIILQHLTPNRMRGQVIALYMLVLSVAGVGFGPMSVGLLTDYVFRSEASLHWSIVTIAIPASLLCAWLCWRAIAAYQAVEFHDQGVGGKPRA